MYFRADDLERLGSRVIAEQGQFDALLNCRICYLWCDSAKKTGNKLVYAETSKLNDKMKAVCGYDFIITFYQPNCDTVSDAALKILMQHELQHVGFDPESGKCTIIPHDVEDFANIVNKYGIEWINRDSF